MKLEGTMYRGAEPTLDGELTPELLAGAVVEACPKAHTSRGTRRAARRPARARRRVPSPASRTALIAERDGEIVIRNGNSFEPRQPYRYRRRARIRGMMAVRDAVRLVFRTQLEDAPDERIIEARKLLNKHLRLLSSASYGPLSSRENVRAFAGDPDQPLLLSLENYDAETKRAQKTAIFERRTLETHKTSRACRDRRRGARDLAERDRRDSLAAHGEAHRPQRQAAAARTGQPCLPQPRRRMGDRRPLSERRCARQAEDRRSRGRSRSAPTSATSKR